MNTDSEPGIVATASRGDSGQALSSDDADERLEQALAEFRTAWDAGERLERGQLLAEYPDIAPQLSECLDTMDLMAELAPQVNVQDAPEGVTLAVAGRPGSWVTIASSARSVAAGWAWSTRRSRSPWDGEWH